MSNRLRTDQAIQVLLGSVLRDHYLKQYNESNITSYEELRIFIQNLSGLHNEPIFERIGTDIFSTSHPIVQRFINDRLEGVTS